MILLALAAQLAVTAVAAPAAVGPDPLTPARMGMLQCFVPDTARKTCQSIAAYKPRPGGAVDNVADLLIAPKGPVVMRVTSPVVVRGEAICGPLRAQDIDSAVILVGGLPLNEPNAGQVKAQLKTAMARMFGVDICTTMVAKGAGSVAIATVNGRPHPEMTQAVMWVKPADGYRVAP